MKINETITKDAVLMVLRDYWHQYKKHPFYSVMAVIFPAVGSIFVFFVPPLIVAGIINNFVSTGTITVADVAAPLSLFAGLWLLGEALWRVGMHYLAELETEGIKSLANLTFSRLIGRDYSFYANNFVGSITKKSLAYTRSFELFTDTFVFNISSNFFQTAFAVYVLAGYSLLLPAVLVFWAVIALVAGIPFIRRRSKLVAQRHDASSLVAGRLADATTNMMAIKSFANEKREQKFYGEYVERYATRFRAAAHYQNWHYDVVMSPIFVAVNASGLISVLYLAQSQALPVGVIVVVYAFYTQVSRQFWEINRIYRNIESSISEAAEFSQLVMTEPDVVDKPGAGELHVRNSAIEFKNVTFNYDDSDEESAFLNNFNLSIKHNEKVGLVGPSGGGKTTITKLLLRFIDVQSGQILVDGQDISGVTQESLRAHIAYVPQEPLLFHRSLTENIGYGKDGAPESEIIEASRVAHADEFISKLPQTYETLVGERGIKLSGGQRQRVAIARALLKEAPILVLDEATSSLDSESEKYIQAGLKELMKNKTALVIAHRLSTIKHLDRIVVLDGGVIVEEGTHDELIKNDGLYAKLWGHQSGEFIES